MDKCNGCKYEYDGLCTAMGEECKVINACTILKHKVRERVLETPIITTGKEEIEMGKKNKECKGCFGASMNDCGSCEKETKPNKHDNINPDHYKERTSIECIDAMIMTFGAKRTAEYCVQNAYKYVWRNKFKNRLEDLKKAEWYLEKFGELVTRCETDFTADGVVEERYIEIGTTLRCMVKTGREEYEHGKGNE